MNECLRLLQKALRPFGYDIRKRNAYNLIPFKGLSDPELDCVRRDFDEDDRAKNPANVDTLKIVYRSSLTPERRTRAIDRVAPAPLDEIVERCFASLISSINAALQEPNAPKIELLILDDRSEEPFLARLKGIAGRLKCPWSLQTSEKSGQGASLHEQFAFAAKDDALYYFCEDDYLHEVRAVFEMWSFYKQVFAATGKHLVLHPQEHEALYNRALYPSYLLLSPWRHWRSTSDTTHHLFLHSHTVRDYWDFFENTKFVGVRKQRRLGSEQRTTCRLFNHMPCFSPIPALAAHMQGLKVLPPFFDWKKVWDLNDPEAQG